MHPYYGTERLTGASPTLIESVDNSSTLFGLPPTAAGTTAASSGNGDGGQQQQAQAAQPSASVGLEPGDLQILQNLTLSQPGVGQLGGAGPTAPPHNVHGHGRRSLLLGPSATTAERLSASSGHITGANIDYSSAGRSGMVYSSVGGSGLYNSVPTSYSMSSHSMSSYSMSHHGANGFGPHHSGYMPVATSTPFVQFTTPINTESLYSQTNTSHGPHVSFNFSSPTFSTPPIQMMAPPVQIGLLSSGMTSSSWQHKVPTSMPWAVTSQNSLSGIEFTATGSSGNIITPSQRTRSSTCNGKRAEKKKVSKRKLGVLQHDVPEKVHINEERMAAHLQQLHLDNNNLQWHPDLEEQWYTQQEHYKSEEHAGDSSTCDEEDEDDDDHATDQSHLESRSSSSKNTAQARLEFSDMLQMGMKSREILPKVILDEINKPCMQIVLWKPPGNFVADVVRDSVWDSPHSSDEMIDNDQSDNSIHDSFVWKCAGGKSETDQSVNAEMDDMDL